MFINSFPSRNKPNRNPDPSDEESSETSKSKDKTPCRENSFISPIPPCNKPDINPEAMWSPVSINPSTMRFSDLMSPFAISTSPPPSNITLNNSTSLNFSNQTTARRPDKIPTPPLPPLYEVGGKQYPDLRHQFIRALRVHALKSRHAAHLRCTFDATIRAIIILSLRETPIRTPYAISRMKGIGREFLKVCQEAEKNARNQRPYIPLYGKFSAVAPAVLVALLEYEKEQEQEQMGVEEQDKECCTLEELLTRIKPLVDFQRGTGLNEPLSYYLDKDTLDPDFTQVSLFFLLKKSLAINLAIPSNIIN